MSPQHRWIDALYTQKPNLFIPIEWCQARRITDLDFCLKSFCKKKNKSSKTWKEAVVEVKHISQRVVGFCVFVLI